MKDALEAVNEVVSQLVLAIRGASSIALIASLLVLAGALGGRAPGAALRCRGAQDPRAPRGRGFSSAYALEYGLLGLATAVFGLLAGVDRGLFIVDARDEHAALRSNCRAPFWPPPWRFWSASALGLVGTWRILSQKPAPYLRNL